MGQSVLVPKGDSVSIKPETQTVEGVILAAGLSTRSGRWKMALPLGDKTVLQRCVEGMLDAVNRIWVVTGWRADQVASLLQGYPKVELVPNPEYRQGMFSSVQAGLARACAERVFLTPGDYALLPPSVYAQMLAVTAEIVIPTHGGKKGHPVLLGHSSVREILALPGDAMLRDYIAESGFATVEVDSPGILLDIDTPEDYAAIRPLARERSEPS
jgi:molybdenum cofactor cytidylyltransferase